VIPASPASPASRQQPSHPAFTGGPVYLDYNATTPVDPRVVEAMLPYLTTHFGNPSSSHAYGLPAREGLRAARTRVAALLGAGPDRPEQIVFTGSGSEADALAIRGSVLAALAGDPARWASARPQVITQASEHPAVLHACEYLRRWHHVEVTVLPVDRTGQVTPGDLAAAVTDRTVLVTIMHANNETGTLQPITDLARIAHQAGALFHTDAAQTAGKIPLDVAALDVDLLTLVGHKMYAPKGIAALYVRDGIRLEPLVGGGGQEHGRRAGTENLPHIVALGTAAELAVADLAAGEPDRLAALRDRLHHTLDVALPGRIHLNGHPHHRLPHTLNISITGITGITGTALRAALPHLAASTGSACHAGHTDPSPVLIAMGVPTDRSLAALRLSLGRWTTPEDVDRAAALITRACS
jgi:cysteine desulfurase